LPFTKPFRPLLFAVRALWMMLVLGMVACGTTPQPTPRPILPPDREAESLIPTAVAPTWREPETPITLENVQQVAYLGRLDSLQPNEGSLFAHAFSIDSTLLAGLNQDYFLGWDLITGTLIYRTSRLDALDLFFSVDKTDLYTIDATGFVRVFDANAGNQIDTFSAQEGYSGAYAFAPLVGLLAVSGSAGEVRVWDLIQREAVTALIGEQTETSVLAFSVDGERLAAGSNSGVISVWAWREQELLYTFSLPAAKGVARLAFSPNGNQLAAATDVDATLWSLESGELSATLATGAGGVDDVFIYSPDGKLILNAGSSETINLWEADTGRLFAAFPNPNGESVAVAFAPDSQLLVTAVFLGEVNVWNLSDPQAGIGQAILPVEDNILDVGWSPDARTLALIEASGSVQVWGITPPEATPTPQS
jgi:WD40 repeat protein